MKNARVTIDAIAHVISRMHDRPTFDPPHQQTLTPRQGWLLLGVLWLAVTTIDRVWLQWDTSVPSWDPADYLRGTLVFWRTLQDPQWFSGDWWHDFWTLRSKTPPLTYTVGAIVQLVTGIGADSAMWAMALFNAVLLAATFGLGCAIASVEVGLWAAGLTVLMPGLYRVRLEFWQDFPLAAMVTLGWAALTAWRATGAQKPYRRRSLVREFLAAAGFSLVLGLTLLTKQTALFFLAVPMLWLGIDALAHRRWGRLGQLIGATAASALVWWPWYSSNWFLMLTAGKRATIDSAALEGDPSLASLDAWTFYARVLPHSVTWPLLVVPLVGVLGYGYWRWQNQRSLFRLNPQLRWLLVFLLGSYLLASLNVNKDSRYILPLLPGLAVLLAMGLARWGQQFWGRQVRWSLVMLSLGLSVLHLFPVLSADVFNAFAGWGIPFQATRTAWPHAEVIDAAIGAEPYLRSTIGVLPSTPNVNQHNINYYGGLQEFQVYGRQVGVRERDLRQDARSMHWFLAKTGEQGSIPKTQAEIVKLVREGGDFVSLQEWTLPTGNDSLQLYRRTEPTIAVAPVETAALSSPMETIALERVDIPSRVPPGAPVPITYQWLGRGDDLQHSIALLQWTLVTSGDRALGSLDQTGSKFWIHDRALAEGHLLTDREPERLFRVTERLAMLPPENAIAGTYALQARTIDRMTGEVREVPILNPVQLEVNAEAKPQPAPEPDLPSQLRQWAPQFRRGDIDPVFAQIGRINQYDPIQDYLEQVAISLNYRLETETNLAETPQTRDTYINWLYAVAVVRAQQRAVPETIAALERAVELDRDNPYAHALLAFVQLYRWKPRAAQPAIDAALILQPEDETIQILNGVAALMRGNAIAAWRILKPLL